MSRKRIYHFFFPEGKDLPLKKVRWTIMVIIQELMLCKFKAILKYFIKPSYRRDINKLRDILSKAPLRCHKSTLFLKDINFSHEINYPKWVDKIEDKHIFLNVPFKRIKVFNDKGTWIVIDGNHRLQAMKNCLWEDTLVDVLILEYK